MLPADGLAAWWSLVEVSPTILGLVVLLIVLSAIAFVTVRLIARLRRRR